MAKSAKQIAAAKKNLEKARAARSKKVKRAISGKTLEGTRLVGGGSKTRKVDPWATRLSNKELKKQVEETAANVVKYKNTPHMPIGIMKQNLIDLRTEVRRRKRKPKK